MKSLFSIISLLLVQLVISPSVLANVNLIISDIDDTVKITHARDKTDAIQNATNIRNHFLLMPDLLNTIVKTNNSKMVYVSKSPSVLSNKIVQMLNFGQFPSGGVYTRKNIFDSKFKIKTISKILNEVKPKTVILIGDNGQADSKDYDVITQLFKDIKFHTYIRVAYRFDKDFLPADQTAFTTPLELLIDLQNKELTPKNLTLIEKFAVKINKELSAQLDQTKEPTLFPHWYNCIDFKWKWKFNFPINSINEAVAGIVNKCSTKY